jgi:hypothetical protein
MVAIFLIVETKGLLLGERADTEIVKDTREIAQRDESVTRINHPLTMHLGPQEILLNLEVEFRPEMTMPQIAAAVDRLETQIRNKHTDVIRIFIEAKALRSAASIAETALEGGRSNRFRVKTLFGLSLMPRQPTGLPAHFRSHNARGYLHAHNYQTDRRGFVTGSGCAHC